MRALLVTIVPLFALSLAACGGGAGGGSLTPIIASSPTPTPTPLAISGKVVQLSGPLAANGTPDAQSTPAAGPGIGGATVYVTSASTSAIAVPTSSPIATATTAPDGSFTITLPKGSNSVVGVAVIDGATIEPNGATDRGFTVAHGIAVAGTPSTFYLDVLTQNEQAGFSAYNAARASNNLPTVSSDTAAEMASRLLIATDEAAQCHDKTSAFTAYMTFGGLSIGGVQVIGAQSNTPYYSAWNSQLVFTAQQNLDFAGFAGPLVGGPQCDNSALPQNYFAEVLVTN